MTTARFEQRIKVAPIFILFAVATALVGFMYRDLPLTGHARTSHQASRYNSETIATMFDEGYCTPQEDHCDGEDTYLSWCAIDEKNAIGLVISTITGRIVTGFKGTINYWENRCGATT